MELLEKYEFVMSRLSDDNKRNVHHRSIKNFITHLHRLNSNRTWVEVKITEYLDLVKEEKGDISKDMTVFLFAKYIEVIGEMYKEIGFFTVYSTSILPSMGNHGRFSVISCLLSFSVSNIGVIPAIVSFCI